MMFKLFGKQRFDDDDTSSGAHNSRAWLFVIQPLSRGRMFWDFSILFVILYSAVEIPFTTAFLRVPPDGMVAIDDPAAHQAGLDCYEPTPAPLPPVACAA